MLPIFSKIGMTLQIDFTNFAVVGVGSLLFHGTLTYSMQVRMSGEGDFNFPSLILKAQEKGLQAGVHRLPMCQLSTLCVCKFAHV